MEENQNLLENTSNFKNELAIVRVCDEITAYESINFDNR